MAYKCFECGEIITNQEMEEAVHFKGRFAHRRCMDSYYKKLSDTKQLKQAEKAVRKRRITTKVTVKEARLPESETEVQQRKGFQKTVSRITGEKPRVEHNAYAKKLIKDYKLTYDDISMALQYHYEIMHSDIKGDANLLGIVPYIIDRAKLYFAKLGEAIDENRNINALDFYQLENTVFINQKNNIENDEPLQLMSLSF